MAVGGRANKQKAPSKTYRKTIRQRGPKGRSTTHGGPGKDPRRQRGGRPLRRNPRRLVQARLRAAESTERQQQRAQKFSELVARNLKEQTEASPTNAQQLSEQAARQQETGQALARESVEAYAGFLDEAFSRYRSGTERAAQSTQEGARAVTDTAASLVAPRPGQPTPRRGRCNPRRRRGPSR